jgi:hypothetical protein
LNQLLHLFEFFSGTEDSSFSFEFSFDLFSSFANDDLSTEELIDIFSLIKSIL